MTGPWTPTSDELAVLFRPLRRYRRLVLAVSGGSDSMALMHVAAEWARTQGEDAPRLTVATVDHGLRTGSDADAALVVEAARALGLDAQILTWRGEKPVQGIQERAREMRYLLLAQHATDGPVPCAIVTAHTEDDQAETVLMRLARGSGPDGLQGMRPVRQLHGSQYVFLVRPFLGLDRESLRSYLAARQIKWVEDPSNENDQFERVRIRQAAGATTSLGLTPRKLALAALRQRRAVDALEAATDVLQQSALDLNCGAFASIQGRPFASAPEELRVRLMSRVLGMFGGSAPPAELAQVERLVTGLDREEAVRATLGGCEIRSCRNTIRVFRERGRSNLPALELSPGEEAIWDDRFLIRVGQAPGMVKVRVFDKLARDRLRQVRTDRLPPARAAATLPAVWVGEDLARVGGLPDGMFSTFADVAVHVETQFIHGRVPARS